MYSSYIPLALLSYSSFTYAIASWQDFTHAEQAAKELNAHYNSDIGLYDQTGWWNNANCLTAITDLALADGNVVDDVKQRLSTTYTKARQQNPDVATIQKRMPGLKVRSLPIAEMLRKRVEDNGFLNHFYDDEGWWALAWLQAYDLTKNDDYIKAAAHIFLDMTKGGPTNCDNGGIYWNKDRQANVAISNELFIATAAGLAVRDTANKQDWINWAQGAWKWFDGIGLINSDNLINDKLDYDCKNAGNETIWSYNQGVIIGGLVDLSKATGDSSYLQRASELASASIGHFADKTTHVISEPACDNSGCDPTSDQFKAAYTRNLAKLYKAAPSDEIKQVLVASGNAAWKSGGGSAPRLRGNWKTGQGDQNTATQSSALEALVGLLVAS